MNAMFSNDFELFNGFIWINCAHQGPLPSQAVEEAYEAVAWKSDPRELTTERFLAVPNRLKMALARLIGGSIDEIILGNSASYGLHLLANGISWKTGDEVLLVKGDFPSDILPWLALENKGVLIRYIEPSNHLPAPEELDANLTSRTRLFCTTWVHSFSGVTANIAALGELCKANDVAFVVNASQGLGARPFAVSNVSIDALVGVGFKWLCGPYGTGFCWVKKKLLQSLDYNQSYWLTEMTSDELGKEIGKIRRSEGLPTARTFDVFGTANFFNFKPWSASIEYLLEIGIERIAKYDQYLVSLLIDGLSAEKYKLLSPREGEERSTLVFVSHRDSKRNHEIYELLKREGINISYRNGNLRFSPHLYNSEEDIERVVEVLNMV